MSASAKLVPRIEKLLSSTTVSTKEALALCKVAALSPGIEVRAVAAAGSGKTVE
ncbi:hypothetical protein [Cupriavidus sp. AcVe19-6a]|uniref:hypothetical protein n=1 Tax=Cupriavidus sp. AcVe19-6a TaxID=2821358 RepID=UPI001AE9570C|nr:hypothetical protein [Cupriavidus sp. AcVe19-6a]MBP0638989.1 hypothetical protein [Cupriavidus sp. AcVe19-6a]